MASTNDITGAEIKSSIYSAQGRDNHDRIFGKKTATEWLQLDEFKGVHILDPDGWRQSDGVSYDDPISYADFHHRFNMSTVSGLSVYDKV